MTPTDRDRLLAIVRLAAEVHGEPAVCASIMDAHQGRPDGWIVTDENMHLFRQYRNTVSGDPRVLINEAQGRAA